MKSNDKEPNIHMPLQPIVAAPLRAYAKAHGLSIRAVVRQALLEFATSRGLIK